MFLLLLEYNSTNLNYNQIYHEYISLQIKFPNRCHPAYTEYQVFCLQNAGFLHTKDQR
jgi:hypothetical protein